MASHQELAEQLFESALALQPDRRQAFLDKACAGDASLRRTVEGLLADDARAGSFLHHSPFAFLDRDDQDEKQHSGDSPDPTVSSFVAEGQLTFGQTLLDRFTIVRFIAKGGMGEVYEAEDRFLQDVHVALKTILPHIASDPAWQQRFEREVLLARKVSHPNLCPIYDIFHCEQPPPPFLFLTMKLLPGQTLAARLRALTPIPVDEALAIVRQMAAGLAAIHEAGIVHRDIKPNNILLDGAGKEIRLSITDFGLARTHDSETTLFSKGTVAGTPGYVAPELFQGHPPSQSSDLFAFGVVVHEIFTGEKPNPAPDGSVTASPRLNTSGAPPFCIQLVHECLQADTNRRCRAFESALATLNLKHPENAAPRPQSQWTRRHFAGAAAAAVCTVAAAAWWRRSDLQDLPDDLLHPLPSKRFIALMNWPKTSDARAAPTLTGVLSAIKSQLARVEAFDRNLFVITPEDVGKDLAQVPRLKEVCDPLGTNLVLAASGSPGPRQFQLSLRLLDPVSGRVLRQRGVGCPLDQTPSLPDKAVHAAASLLNVSHYVNQSRTAQPATQSPAAFNAFQAAETWMKQSNDNGLNQAIDEYKKAVELDPRYALAHAKLALAYGRLYAIRRDPGVLDLAHGNSDHALTIDPTLVEGHLARVLLLEQTGDEQGALDEIGRTLALDPSNPRTILEQARIYARLNRWSDAEKTFNRVIEARPNSWVTYNELGAALHEQGKFQEALQAFHDASAAAPGSAMALSNLGVEYLQIGDFSAAAESLKKSLALEPGFAGAAANTSLSLRYQGKYGEALPFALKAVQLNPTDDTNWLELGECYSSMHNHQADAKAAYLHAAREVKQHLRTDATNGPNWILLALYQTKSGDPQNALALIKKADALGDADMDSQLYKARILELLGRRDEALTTLAACFRKGATPLQIAPFPDLQSLRQDPRYQYLLHFRPANPPTT